jgi:hypothetical protein
MPSPHCLPGQPEARLSPGRSARRLDLERGVALPRESYGWEAQILRNGELTIGRRCLLKAEAVKWAEVEKAHADERVEWVE